MPLRLWAVLAPDHRRFLRAVPAADATTKGRGGGAAGGPPPPGKDTLFSNAEEASEYFLREAHISTVPWDDAGAFLRFSATFAAKGETDERRVTTELKERLKALDLKF